LLAAVDELNLLHAINLSKGNIVSLHGSIYLSETSENSFTLRELLHYEIVRCVTAFMV